MMVGISYGRITRAVTMYGAIDSFFFFPTLEYSCCSRQRGGALSLLWCFWHVSIQWG